MCLISKHAHAHAHDHAHDHAHAHAHAYTHACTQGTSNVLFATDENLLTLAV